MLKYSIFHLLYHMVQWDRGGADLVFDHFQCKHLLAFSLVSLLVAEIGALLFSADSEMRLLMQMFHTYHLFFISKKSIDIFSCYTELVFGFQIEMLLQRLLHDYSSQNYCPNKRQDKTPERICNDNGKVPFE